MIARATADTEVELEAADVLDYEPTPEELEAAEHAAAIVGRALGENDGRINPDWPLEIGVMARVILYEENRQKLIEHWDHLQRMKSNTSRRR